MIRRITTDPLGQIYEVVHMIDRFGRNTEESAIAAACVIELSNGWIEQDADDVPIYTVH